VSVSLVVFCQLMGLPHREALARYDGRYVTVTRGQIPSDFPAVPRGDKITR
jgi:hypothetical protein